MEATGKQNNTFEMGCGTDGRIAVAEYIHIHIYNLILYEVLDTV